MTAPSRSKPRVKSISKTGPAAAKRADSRKAERPHKDKPTGPKYWIFKCQTQRRSPYKPLPHFKLRERMLDPDPDTNLFVSRYHQDIKAGDGAFIWENGSPGGICAVLEIAGIPFPREMGKTDRKYCVDGLEIGLHVRARANYVTRNFFLSRDEIKPAIPELSIFSMSNQGTNYPVKPAHAKKLLAMIRKKWTEEQKEIAQDGQAEK